jgi:hypothetical protein
MKCALIICLSLLLSGGLKLSQYPVSVKNSCQANIQTQLPGRVQSYWLKKTRKEVIRDAAYINPICKAINNSLHFIYCGFSAKSPIF